MPATLEALVKVRSQKAEAALAYLRKTEDDLAHTPLLARFGRSLDEMRIPLRVVPFEPRHEEEAAQTEHLRPPSPSPDEDEPAKKRYAFRSAPFDEERRTHHPPQPLAEVEPHLQHAVLLADPGGGKTEWLKLRARQAVCEGIEKLENQTRALSDITFPAFLRLNDVAKVLGRSEEEEKEQERVLRDFLVQKGCLPSPPAVLDDAQRVAAAMLVVLVQKHHLPERLVPFVWRQWFPLSADIQESTPSSPASMLTRPLLYLDAWDEVRGGQETLARCLNAFAQRSPCRIFLTSRIVGYAHRPLPVESKAEGSHRELHICAFEWSDTEQFVTFWFRGGEAERGRQMLVELRSKISVWGMASNPLMATLLCLAFSPNSHRRPLPFPLQRGAVYERVLWGLLGEWRRQREAPEQTHPTDAEKKRIEAKLHLLASVASSFFQHGAERFARTALEGAVQTYLESNEGKALLAAEVMRLPQGTVGRLQLFAESTRQQQVCQKVAAVLCEELIEEDGVLAKDSEDEKETFYSFLHLTFQEYLTACALERQGWQTIAALVDKKAWLPEWQEVIVLLAGKLADPKPLLTMLSEEEPTETNPYGDDHFRHRLALAALCLPEIHSAYQTPNSELFDSITTSAFSLWWRHAVERTAEATPHLARALPALGQVRAKIDAIPLATHLARLLTDAAGDVRWAAAGAVGDIGSAAATPEILASLARRLTDADGDVWRAAARAVGRFMAQGVRLFQVSRRKWIGRSVEELSR